MLKVPDGFRSVTTIQEFSSRTIRVRMAPMGKSGLNMNNRISDEKLIEKVKQGEAAAVQEMCRRYRLLIKKLISARFVQRFRDDLEQYLWMVFLERMQTFRPEKAQFSTMISKVLTYERWNYFKRKKKEWFHEVVYSEAEEPCAEDRRENLAWEEVRAMQKRIKQRLSPEARQVFTLLLQGVTTERQMAGRLHVTRYHIRKQLEEIRQAFYFMHQASSSGE